ncbi:Phosphatidylinositol 4-kinase beta [Phytophthora pseudosyringae]|uniref:Phosphatidylinositol 4-kinase beta n=1 Tax=Phytophthora pseudosyringae TaxID=221518 RepID=A0A8T1VDI3_9STRA|nr:Phosphatidylinositol 4-kinase beta [Phytophthora pseudosyringae]
MRWPSSATCLDDQLRGASAHQGDERCPATFSGIATLLRTPLRAKAYPFQVAETVAMEGYLWKRGRKVPSMKRHYAVLKGTMLSFFVTQDEAQRSGAVPKRVLEITDLRLSPGAPSADASHPAHVVLKYLDADGGGTLQCRADSRETQQLWLEALQHALKEPERMAQEEIAEVQEELVKDAQRHSRAVQQATEAVEAAGRQHREQAHAEAALQQNRDIAVELHTQLDTARALQGEALQKLQALQLTLEEARQRVHASSLGSEDSPSSCFDQAMEAVERLAAKVEVAASAEATHGRNVELLELLTVANSKEQQELAQRVQACAEESKSLRQVAAKSLEDAQRAKQRAKRLASWGDDTGPGDEGANARPSQLDPLVEGYLLCQHPMRTTMHRRYYVLTGNTLCWYADQDAFVNKMDAPSGVLHVAEVAEWDGRVKPTSPIRRLVVPFSSSAKAHANEQHPHAFAVLTVEGKTLRCSAPLKKSQEDWVAALHVGLTMPPLSPHRARAAKSRRDSFDLLASTPLSPKRQRSDEAKDATKGPEQTSAAPKPDETAAIASSDTAALTSEVVVEGYVVGKSSLEEAMKKKYCVLRALTLYVFTTHQEAASPTAAGASGQQRTAIRSTTFHVCGVSNWDGHATLMHYDHGFLLQTTEHQSIYCSAPSLQEKNRWVNGVQQALLQFQHDAKRSANLFHLPAASDDDDEEKTGQLQRRPSYASARREFLAILQQYYAEYHPGKLGDVPMLLSRYQGREHALVEHLDRLYGTSMAKDANVQVVLTALVNPVPAPSPKPPSTHSAPPSPAARAPNDLTDWLTWNKDTSASFCVLSGNRLERFESKEQSKAGSLLAVFLVTGVHDYPTPSPTMNRLTLADQQLQFFLSGGYELEAQGAGAPTELLVLQATTAEAKQKWMSKLRSGLTPTPPKPNVPQEEPSPVVQAKTKPSLVITTQATTFQEKMVEFYQRHNAKRVGDVGTLLTSFAGRERQLLAALDATYDTNVSSDGSFDAFLPEPSPPNTHPQNTLIHREGYLSVKHPRLGAAFRKCFCVLNGVSWQCFDSSVVAHSGHSALLADAVVSLHPVTAKLAESLAFRLETQTNGVIMLRSDAAEILHDWIHALRTAVANQPLHADVTLEMKSNGDQRSSFLQLRARIVEFYEKHNPSKVYDVDSLLQSFEGREGALLEQIDTVYKSQLATDPVCTSLCADLAVKYSEEHANASPSQPSSAAPADEAILMEGYLMKRGHKIPSMRKRYCVLLGNELSYYVTHDDSKNPGGGAMTAPLGNFRVEVVGDWHGKTATHNYEHGMEVETTDGKTFFCAASTAKDKQQWVDAFRRGIALARNQQRRAEIEDETAHASGETEHERQLREQFREKLAGFYRVRNPAKLPDLDLLLSCYAQRELALLQAIDEAYGTGLAADESLLALLPPLPEQATALATLKLDGYLKKTAGDNSNSLWKRAQNVYVALDGLTLTLFATREGFKSGGAGLDDSMTVLAVRDDDTRQSTATRFAVETSDHEWLRFEARDAMEKRLWMQVLRAALDTVLAQSLLADDRSMDKEDRRASGVAVDARGFLLLRLDFDCAQDEHWKRREIATPIEERAVALENGNEFVVTKATSSLKLGVEQARFRVVSTRAWTPSARCWPVTAGTRAPRFPFQIVTQEQFVLSCSAATDAERAKWIRQLRLGAEQAAALEMLEEQLLETKAPMSPGRRSLVDKRGRGFNEDGEVIAAPLPVVGKEPEEEEPPMTGYVSFRLARSPLSSGEARHASQVPIPHEGFVVLNMRAHVAVYEDESAYYRRDAPVCEAQAVELLSDGVASLDGSSHSPKTKSQLRHLFPGATTSVPSSLAFAVLLHPLREGAAQDSSTGDRKEEEEHASMLELFPTLPSQRDLWMEAFASRIDLARGEALLADERIMLKLERDDGEDVEVKKNTDGVEHETHTSSDEGDSTDDSGFEDKPLTVDVSMASEGTTRIPVESKATPTFVFRTAAMEGALTPWQTSTSPIRLPGSSKMKPMDAVYAVLVGCRLRCYQSREAAAASTAANSSRRNVLTAADDEPSSLDVEVIACSSWEAPATSWLSIGKEDESLGVKVDVKGSRHSTCFTAPNVETKLLWIQVMQHELNFVVAERSLSISERQFTQEVAAHLASIAAATEAADASATETVSNVTRTSGYLRVRHHNLGSIWRDRFVVLEGSTLSVFSENCQLDDEGKPRFPNLAVESHELVGVEKWHPVFTSLGRSGSGLKGIGFRAETSSGVYLECTATNAEDSARWKSAISAATTKETTASTVSRDATLPFIPGARMEGYLKLKDPHKATEKKKKAMKMKPLKLWKTRYCVVMGPHWLVYANQAQAISSGEAPTPVAVYELLGIAEADGEVDGSANEFSIHVVPGKQVKCRARSSLERKRWVNAVEDELLTQAQTTEDLERSVKEREDKLAAREAVKSKMHEVNTDARRLSAMLGEAIQSARGDSDTDCDSETHGDSSGEDSSLRQRSGPDYIDGSPESSPMRRNVGEMAFPFDKFDDDRGSSSSFKSFFACFFRCIPMNSTGSNGRNVIAPLGIPGYPSTAAACNPMYTCDYYQDDGYRGLAK